MNHRIKSGTMRLRAAWLTVVGNIWNLFLVILLNLCGHSGAQEARMDSQAVELYRCDFEQASDVNFDGWPDAWTRRRGRGYPQYITAQIEPRADRTGNCLAVTMDGGAALLMSPPLPVAAPFSYAIDCEIKVEQLVHDRVTVRIEYLDEQQQVLQSLESEPEGEGDWRMVRLGPFAPQSRKCRHAVISLHIRPGEREDIQGRVLLDKLVFRRLPQISLVTVEQSPLYQLGDPITVRAEITGIVVTDSVLTFELRDFQGQVLATHRQPLGQERLSGANDGFGSREAWATETWQPPVREPGFYYVAATLAGRDGQSLERFVRVAVIEPQPVPTAGEFGWTLPDGNQPLGVVRLMSVLRHAGLNWVKYPVWHGERDLAKLEEVASFADQVDQLGMQMVGLLDRPPPEIYRGDEGQAAPPVAIIFADPLLSKPSVDAVLTNLSLKVRWWQLGGDHDTSFVGDPELPGKLNRVREQLNRFGESMRLGFVWQSMHRPPVIPGDPHSFLVFTDHPAPTAREMLQFPRHEKWQSEAAPWFTLTPLEARSYEHAIRIRDLVQRMVATKINGAGMAAIPQPFDDEQGLFYRDGTPGELLLPWRTTALALAGREYVGSVQLHRGSENHLFSSGKDAVMVLWNDTPGDEEIYLGEDLHAHDLWGRRVEFTERREEDRRLRLLPVGPDPVFVFGVQANLARFCRSFQFENLQLQSLLGKEQLLQFKFENPFSKSLSGKVTLHAPALLASSSPVYLRAAAGETRREGFPVLLKTDAGSGIRNVRLDFELNGERGKHVFSIYRQVNVGLEGIEVQVESRLTKENLLELQIQMANQTQQRVAFQCHVFSPGRRREKIQVAAPPGERTSTTLFLPEGRELAGQELLLRFEELGGSRIMNQMHVARE